MAIQMTRDEYNAKYGQAPSLSSSQPIKMTRAEYDLKYGKKQEKPSIISRIGSTVGGFLKDQASNIGWGIQHPKQVIQEIPQTTSNLAKKATFGVGNLLGDVSASLAYQAGGKQQIDELNRQGEQMQIKISNALKNPNISQKTKENLLRISQKYHPTTAGDIYGFANKTPGQIGGEALGAVADIATFGVGSAGLKTAFSQGGVKGLAKYLSSKEGMKFLGSQAGAGATTFSLGGLGSDIADNKTIEEAIGNIPKNALTGALLQPTAEVFLGLVGNQVNKVLKNREKNKVAESFTRKPITQESQTSLEKPVKRFLETKQSEIKAAAIEGEKGLYEAPSHAEAIKEAQNAGEDIAMKDKQAEGKFTTTDGRVIDRKQAKEEFGVSQSHEVPKLKEEHDLMEQAKKYKTADEFAEKLGENYYRDIESDIVKPVKNSSGSKNLLKGSDNKPITMFHGTQTNFAGVFDPLKLGDATSAKSAKGAFFFTSEPDVALSYATEKSLSPEISRLRKKYVDLEEKYNKTGNPKDFDLYQKAYSDFEDAMFIGDQKKNPIIKKTNVEMKNPLVYDFKGSEVRPEKYADIIEKAKSEGKDGVIFKNTFDSANNWGRASFPHDVYAVFSNKQIKNTETLDINKKATDIWNKAHEKPETIKKTKVKKSEEISTLEKEVKKSERELKQYEKEQVYQIKQIEDQLSEMKFAGTEFEEQYSDFRELVRKFRTPRQRESILNGDIDNIKKVLEGKISPREIDDIFHSTDMNENDVLYMFREELQKSKKTKEEILKEVKNSQEYQSAKSALEEKQRKLDEKIDYDIEEINKQLATPPTQEVPKKSGIQIIGGTGKIKKRGAALTLQERAVEEGLKPFEKIEGYRQLDFKKQKEKIAQLISEDREKAIRVALGEEQHKGVVPELVLEALSKSGDAELIARIGTESGLIKEATEMGRRIRAWGEVSPNNPIKIIGDLVKERSKSVEGKISSEVKKAISQVKKVKIPKETWASFIDSIKC